MNWSQRWHYTKHLFWRHRQAIAYAFLTFWVAFALYQGQQQRDADRARAKAEATAIVKQRVERTDQLSARLADGSVQGCIADNRTIGQLRTIISTGKQQTRSSIAALVKDGTFSQKQGQRIINQNIKSANESLRKLPLRDCQEAVFRYSDQISNPQLRSRVENEARIDIAIAKNNFTTIPDNK